MKTTNKTQSKVCGCGMKYDQKPSTAAKCHNGWYLRCACNSTLVWKLQPNEESLPNQPFIVEILD